MKLENAINEIFDLAGVSRTFAPPVVRVFRAAGVKDEVPPHVMNTIRSTAEQLKSLGVK